MPFSPIDFTRGPLIGSPFAKVGTGLGAGFQMVQNARKMAQDIATQKAQADLLREKLKYAGPLAEAKLRPALLHAQLLQEAMKAYSEGQSPQLPGQAQGQPGAMDDGTPPLLRAPSGMGDNLPASPTGLPSTQITPEQASLLGNGLRTSQGANGTPSMGAPPQMPMVAAQASMNGGQMPTDSLLPNEQVVSAGNPARYRLDKLLSNEVLAKELGLKGVKTDTKVNDKTGETIVTREYPSGKITQQVAHIGMTPEELERRKELGKSDVKFHDEALKSYQSGLQQVDTLTGLSKILTNENFANMRSDLFPGTQLKALQNVGTPEQQELIGRFLTNSGQVIADKARLFPGQFRIGEQALFMAMKPNANDTVAVAIGKTKAALDLLKMMNERSRLTAKLIRDGRSSDDAIEAADKMIDGDKIRAEVKNMFRSHKDVPRGTRKPREGYKFVMSSPGKVREVAIEGFGGG